jgi:glycosyltransferase involved in cell wall biosynthesis
MSQLYADVDFTVIPYTTAHGGKECPRSLVESLATGVPVLVSCVAAISAFVEEHSCGKSHGLDADSFSAALDSAIGDYERLSGNAVRCARDYFDLRSTFSQYADIYDTLA